MKKLVGMIIVMAMILTMAVSAFADSYNWAEEPGGLTIGKIIARYISIIMENNDIDKEEYVINIIDGAIEGYEVIFTLSEDAREELGEQVDECDMYVWHFNDAGTSVYIIEYLDGEIIDADYEEVDWENFAF